MDRPEARVAVVQAVSVGAQGCRKQSHRVRVLRSGAQLACPAVVTSYKVRNVSFLCTGKSIKKVNI